MDVMPYWCLGLVLSMGVVIEVSRGWMGSGLLSFMVVSCRGGGVASVLRLLLLGS